MHTDKLWFFVWALLLSVISFSPLHAQPLEDFRAAIRAIDRGDYSAAVPVLRTLAAQDMSGAKWALGVLYFEGKGLPQNYQAAFSLYRDAAQQGHPFAQYEVAVMYDRGLGIAKDPSQAAFWFRRSANQGHGMAQVNLGALHSTGEGVPKSNTEAYKWFAIAAKGGGTLDTPSNAPVKLEASRRRDALERSLTPEQLSDANRMVSNWMPQIERR